MTIKKLSADEILSFIAGQVKDQTWNQDKVLPKFSIIVADSLVSTNSYLLEQIANGLNLKNKTVLIAENQTGGRGQQGRTWISVPGNILLSFYWQFQGKLTDLSGLSLVVGIAITRVIKANGLYEVKLKWPNDVFWHQRKMGGILIETKQNKSGYIDVVIGIGLNIVAMDEYSAQITQKFVALENALQRKVYRNKLLAQLLVELDIVLTTFALQGFDAFLSEWKSLEIDIPV